MATLPYILFCESPIESNKVDPDYETELFHAQNNGFETILFNFEELTSAGNPERATRKIRATSELTKVIYRGWMLTPKQYAALYGKLLEKNFQLVNTVTEYQNCHYLPDSLKFIRWYTPKTVYKNLSEEDSFEKLLLRTTVFGDNPVIVKDYVKSEKHDWDTACFVPNASDTNRLKQTIFNFIELRGKYLNEGIVVREFIPLNQTAVHSKSGMPLAEEYRLFFCNKKLSGISNYWEGGKFKMTIPETAKFEKIAENIPSNFFTMDIARKKDGRLIIIELGDGQVSGLPENLDQHEFYRKLREYFG